MKLEWYDDLAIGVTEIDDQHKELFSRFGRLLEACNSGCGMAEVGSLLLFLDEYVQTHFRDEERLQLSSGVPDFAAHREQHRQFIDKLNRLKQEMRSEGATLSLIITTNTTLIDWLVNHIARMDKKIGEFLRSRTGDGNLITS